MAGTSFSIRTSTEVKAALQDLADQDQRPLSNLIQKILVDYLTANGFEIAPSLKRRKKKQRKQLPDMQKNLFSDHVA